MAIEAIAASLLVKEVAGQTAVEATKQLAEKMALETLEQTQLTQSVEQTTAAAKFRIGEVSSPELDKKNILEAEEKNAVAELNDKIENYSEDDKYVASDLGDKDTVRYDLHTRNECLEGDQHPVTGVSFERKTVIDANGNEVSGVFPKFDSKFDLTLPEDKLQATDSEQFAECNEQLQEAIKKDSKLSEQFTPEQLEQIENGDTPDGYTWHHNEDLGKMQLVDSDIHAGTGHTGGKSIWGGGTEFR